MGHDIHSTAKAHRVEFGVRLVMGVAGAIGVTLAFLWLFLFGQ